MKAGFAVIIILAGVIGGLVIYQDPGNWAFAGSLALLVFGTGMALWAGIMSSRFSREQKLDQAAMRLYERDLSERLARLEHRIHLADETGKTVEQLVLDGQEVDNSLARLERHVGEIEEYLANGKFVEAASEASGGEFGDDAAQTGAAGKSAAGKSANVISLGAAAEARKKKQSGERDIDVAGIGEGKLKLQPLFQPIVSLPHKELAYYEAFARLVNAQGEYMEAAVFLPELEKAGRVAEVDMEILNSVVALIRKLQRDGREKDMPGVFWNVSSSSLANDKNVEAIRDALKANAPLASMIIPELDANSVERATVRMQKEVGQLVNQGYRLSMDVSADWEGFKDGYTGRNLRKVVTRLIDATDKLPISFLKVPARVLLVYKDDSDMTMVDMLHAQLAKRNITLIGTQVEREEQAIGLIDNYIEHAQGSFICPPKPVRPDNSGKSNAASAG